MKILSVKKHCIVPYQKKVAGVIDFAFAELSSQQEFKDKYFAFTCMKYSAKVGLLYCGTTNFGNNLLYTFDPQTGEFNSLGYQNFAEPYEIKIHRALEMDKDGKIYGATSCLHGPDKRLDAPGGKVFCYDPEMASFKCLCIPKEHDYIQTISLDSKRKMVYGFTYPVFDFFAYSIEKEQVVYRQFMDSISHISAIDDNGGYWGTWSYQHKLFRYDPQENKVKFFPHGFPEKGGGLMYRNSGPIDCMINGKDGYLYTSTDLGSLYKLDPQNGKVEFLGKPFSSDRLPGLALGNDGLLYLGGGNDNECMLAIYDREKRVFSQLGHIAESEQELCFRTHDIEIVDNKIFVGETDNPKRTDYLWECTIG